MLASTGLGDNTFLSKRLGQYDLADGIVDLVCAGVIEIFAL